MGSAPPLSAGKKDSFPSNSSLLDAMGCTHVSTALYIPSHFPGCLSNWIHLLPDVAHLAESVAHAAARFSQRFKVFTKSSKRLTRCLQFCCGWQSAELQQGKQEGSRSAHSHDAWKAKKYPGRQRSNGSVWRLEMLRVNSATQRCGRSGF